MIVLNRNYLKIPQNFYDLSSEVYVDEIQAPKKFHFPPRPYNLLYYIVSAFYMGLHYIHAEETVGAD